MDLFAFTRQLIDAESVSGNEAQVAGLILRELQALGYAVTTIPVGPQRYNIFAIPTEMAKPEIIFSTHMDTVPPFFPSSEDAQNIYGRGACDAKGIITAQVAAVEKLRKEKIAAGLLFVVGEERDSLGAKVANQHAAELLQGAGRFLINGEPTENRVATASKGTLRVEIVARGKLAHSAYPHLGESAIERLIFALERLRKMPLPAAPEAGACTMNIGVIEGGRAPNVIADHARAQLLYRLVGASGQLRESILDVIKDLTEVQADFVLEIPFVKLRTVKGVPTMLASFTTDIPALDQWGEPILLGPGSIHVAHTEREFIAKKDLTDAVELYSTVAKRLLQS